MHRNQSTLAIVIGVMFVGCVRSAQSPRPESVATDVDGQVLAGEALYEKYCASCHGPQGRNGNAPSLTGSGALPVAPPEKSGMREAPFHRVSDVAEFTLEAMPPGKSGRLSVSEHYAVLAYLLSEDGVELSEPLTPQSASKIALQR